ncbi:mechanosensitive ion channel family protein [Paramicrobacterium chengjingii]|uniref:Mechanosensitive ion channel family protein n=1 Tax=Paramicrobacterium chengjingii TaxID=2769067 RepID=A0ABX6YGK0_9MICO|nr:mechanosensitive ion channel family protein [Microbacterium chengjingii]QPZ37878.1 mechanosensitive ion channel family protein [Microbacterium chengjingii]
MDPLQSWLTFAIALVATAIVVVAIFFVIALGLTSLQRRKPALQYVRARCKLPFRTLISIAALWGVVAAAFPLPGWIPGLVHLLSIIMIGLVAWLLVSAVYVLADVSNAKYAGAEDTIAARRMRTQMTMVRRLLIVIVVVIALGSILMTFPGIRTIGASVLASAGIASIVAGLAAQTVLGNLIAGVQLAFSDAARVGDVVVVEGEWGRIGEITLAYVVVDIWDERRLIVPCTYFTSQPFTNWTRNASQILGTIPFEIDWRVNIAAMRVKLHEVLDNTELWDGRSGSLQIIDATGGFVTARSTVSAADSGKLWDLQCLVREEMISWLQKTGNFSLPVTRVQMIDGEAMDRKMARSGPKGAEADSERDSSGMFSGSPEAEARGSMFTGAIPVQEQEKLDQQLADSSKPVTEPQPVTSEQPQGWQQVPPPRPPLPTQDAEQQPPRQ